MPLGEAVTRARLHSKGQPQPRKADIAGAVKAMCDILGHNPGPVRSPGVNLTKEQRAVIEAEVRKLPAAYFS